MDYKFLNKVVNQIVSETKIDYDQGIIHFPYLVYPSSWNSSSFLSLHPSFLLLSLPRAPRFFFKHCRDVYGLNGDEVYYLWKEYRKIIKDKIKNNEL